MNTPKAFAILGPTAGGKTALALKIAEALRAACLEEFGEQAVTGRLKAVYAQVLAQ